MYKPLKWPIDKIVGVYYVNVRKLTVLCYEEKLSINEDSGIYLVKIANENGEILQKIMNYYFAHNE